MIPFRNKLILSVFLLLSLAVFSQDKANYKLIVFEGSDWCSNCLRLERNVLSQASFTEYSSSVSLEIERIDFPQRNEQDEATRVYNAEVAEKYEFKGIFPTVLLVDNSNGEVHQIPYRKEDVDQFIGKLDQFMDQ